MKDLVIAEMKKNRPNLTDSSLKTYASMLSSMFNKLKIEKDISNIKKNKKEIIEYVKSLEKPQSRKTLLSSLVILTDDDDYKSLMGENTKIINDSYKEQKANPEKFEDMKTMDELKEQFNQLQLKAKKNPTEENWMNVLMSCLFTGVCDGLPPRRLLDYTEMKKSNYNKDEDNYVTSKEFVFNKYKTAKHTGKQVIEIPKEVQTVLKKVMKFGESDYLLHSDNKPFTTTAMSKKLKSLFGVSVDGLRSIYISNLYKGLPALKHLEEIAEDMGHSVDTAMKNYIKTDLQR